MKEEIDIIIPCYNPSKEWVNTLIENYKTIQLSNSYSFNFILINDGSTQGITPNNILILNKNISHLTYLTYTDNRGKGYAIRYGLKHSKSDISFFTDIDFPYGTDIISEMISEIKTGSDLILSLRDDTYYNQITWTRKIISKILKFSIKLFFRIPYSDTQGGLKGFSKRGKELLLKTKINRYLFDLELVKLATKFKLKIRGIHCQLKPNVILSSIGIKVLVKEFSNFYRIWKI